MTPGPTRSEAPVRVLVVDDDENDFLIARRKLAAAGEGRYRVERAESCAEGLACLAAGELDVALVDHRLGDDTGIELIKKAVAQGCERPLILLTGTAHAGIDLEAIRAGASDYLQKDTADATALDRSIRYSIERARRLSAEKQAARAELHAKLVQSEKLAALGELGAGIAHELNQPITVIQGFAQRLLARPERTIGGVADELGIILEAANRMAGIVENIRAFARDSETRLEPTPAGEPLEAALRLVSQQLENHGISIERTVALELPLLSIDRVRLAQVFLNLLGNARDALDEPTCRETRGNPRIRVSIERRASEGRGPEVVYTVEDNGKGVPDAIRGKIFDPFFTTKPPGKGTGLGLSISHGIVAEHGGRIECEPAPGGGARFTVAIPIPPGRSA